MIAHRSPSPTTHRACDWSRFAQLLVTLGIDLHGPVTRSTLQSGIAYALNRTRESEHLNLPKEQPWPPAKKYSSPARDFPPRAED